MTSSAWTVADEKPIVFRRLAIESFRGFNDRQDFDLAANVVVLRGPNGLGKTSVFDALQWLLVGDIARLKESRLRPSDEYNKNEYAGTETARVSAELSLAGQQVSVVRTGNRSGSTLAWEPEGGLGLRGRAAEVALGAAFGASEDVSLETALTAAGLLQQDAARLVLKGTPRDRFSLFSQLLGLGSLQRFEAWANKRSKEAADRSEVASQREVETRSRLKDLVRRLDHLQNVARTRPAVAEVQARLIAALEGHYVGDHLRDWNRDRAASLAASATNLAQECDALARLASSLPEQQSDQGLAETERATLEERVQSLNERLDRQRAVIRATEDTLRTLDAAQAELQRLASAALPLLGDRCPVCEQSIQTGLTRARLLAITGESEQVGMVHTELAGLREAEITLLRDLETTSAALRRIQSRILQLEQTAARREELRSRLAGLGDRRWGFQVRIGLERGVPTAAAALHRLMDTLQVIAGLARELVVAIDASKSSEEGRLEREIASLRDQVASRSEQLEADARRAAKARELHQAAKAARLDVVRRRLDALTPIAQDVYSRMDAHPTFTDIALVSEMFRAAGTTTARVRDERADIEADPMLVFSAAQANITAISYLVALNWAAGGRVPMLLMDDPIQAMDDINVLGFADLCRHLRRERQLIVSTHERRFADLIERKLAPRRAQDRALVLEFTGWDRSGPQVKLREVPDETAIGAAQTLVADQPNRE